MKTRIHARTHTETNMHTMEYEEIILSHYLNMRFHLNVIMLHATKPPAKAFPKEYQNILKAL